MTDKPIFDFKNSSIDELMIATIGLPEEPEKDDLRYVGVCALRVLDDFLTTLKTIADGVQNK